MPYTSATLNAAPAVPAGTSKATVLIVPDEAVVKFQLYRTPVSPGCGLLADQPTLVRGAAEAGTEATSPASNNPAPTSRTTADFFMTSLNGDGGTDAHPDRPQPADLEERHVSAGLQLSSETTSRATRHAAPGVPAQGHGRLMYGHDANLPSPRPVCGMRWDHDGPSQDRPFPDRRRRRTRHRGRDHLRRELRQGSRSSEQHHRVGTRRAGSWRRRDRRGPALPGLLQPGQEAHR